MWVCLGYRLSVGRYLCIPCYDSAEPKLVAEPVVGKADTVRLVLVCGDCGATLAPEEGV